MRRALTAEQSRAFERQVMDDLDLSLSALMDLVGTSVADRADSLAPTGRIIVMTGTGNNAGDGWVAGQRLNERGREVRVLAFADPDDLPEVAREAASSARHAGTPWALVDPSFDLSRELEAAALVVDALFGFGLRGPVRDPFASAIAALEDAGTEVLSVDLPSGVESDTGQAHGPAVTADHTIAVLSLKIGHVQEPGASLAGQVDVADLGLAGLHQMDRDGVEVWEAADVAAVLPPLDPLDHKGSRGRVLLVGGSSGMSGSIALATWGALRAGAGYAVVAVPASLVDVVDHDVMPAVIVALPEEDRALGAAAVDVVLSHAGRADTLVVGPGIGGTDVAREAARRIMAGSDLPLVADADALNALVGHADLLYDRTAPSVITPHPGEAGRLLDMTAAAVQADRLMCASRLGDGPVVSVLKGARTIVSGGGRQAVVTTGNPGMATMGTGDVLAGVIGALLAQGADPFDAAMAGAYVHGLAGDIAAAELTRTSLTAADLAERLPAAFAEVLEMGT